MKKKGIKLLLPVLAVSFLLSACSVGGKEIVIDKSSGLELEGAVFSVNGKACPKKEAKLYLANYKNLYGSVYGIDLWKQDLSGQSLEDYVKDVTLEELSRIYCMDLIAEEKEIALTEEENGSVSSCAADYWEELSAAEKDFTGLTQADLEECYRHYALAEKLYHSLTDDVDVEISDDEARVLDLLVLTLTDSDQEKEAMEQKAEGKDIEAIAAALSLTAESATTSREDCPDDLEEILFDMETGECTDVCDYEGKRVMIGLESQMDEKLTEANRLILSSKRQQADYEEAYKDFLENGEFRLNSKLWDQISFSDQELEELTTDEFFEIYDNYFEK